MAANLEDARAARDRAAQVWEHQVASLETRNWRPTPTRAETTKIASGNPVMLKEWDLSPIDPAALDTVFDPDEPPLAPAEIPIVFGVPICGHELHASPGKITPRRAFAWLRRGGDPGRERVEIYAHPRRRRPHDLLRRNEIEDGRKGERNRADQTALASAALIDESFELGVRLGDGELEFMLQITEFLLKLALQSPLELPEVLTDRCADGVRRFLIKDRRERPLTYDLIVVV